VERLYYRVNPKSGNREFFLRVLIIYDTARGIEPPTRAVPLARASRSLPVPTAHLRPAFPGTASPPPGPRTFAPAPGTVDRLAPGVNAFPTRSRFLLFPSYVNDPGRFILRHPDAFPTNSP
jgi:hypothetical protein